MAHPHLVIEMRVSVLSNITSQPDNPFMPLSGRIGCMRLPMSFELT